MDDKLVEQVAVLFAEQGWAHVRTGSVRTDAEARAIIKKAAEAAEVKVTSAKGDNYVKATVGAAPEKAKPKAKPKG